MIAAGARLHSVVALHIDGVSMTRLHSLGRIGLLLAFPACTSGNGANAPSGAGGASGAAASNAAASNAARGGAAPASTSDSSAGRANGGAGFTAGGSAASGASAGASSGGKSNGEGTAGATSSGGSGASGGMFAASGGNTSGDSGGTPPGGAGASSAGLGGMNAGGAGASGAAGAGASSGTVTVELTRTEQTMVGFGINDAWAPRFTDAQADELFDPNNPDGIGLTVLRIGMGSDGNPLAGSDSDAWGDIKKAKARGVTTFIASVWSAPANCKTNDNVNDGGHLIANDGGACYTSWADTIALFPGMVKANAGVDLYAMSIGNEPDFASCGTNKPCNGNYPTMLYTADEAVAFTKVAAPKLHALNPPVKVISPEASEWIHLWTDMSAPGSTDPLKGTGYDYGHALAADATVWSAIDIVGVHEYDTQVAEPWPSDVPRTKPIWQTEMSGVRWWPEDGPSSDIANGVVVAGWIHDAIVNGPASAWIWWWYQAGPAANQNDNEGLWLQNGMGTKREYTLGNFSKFVRPGYVRVDVSGSIPAGVLLSAYESGTDGTLVVVAINQGKTDVSFPISIAGGSAPASLTPYVTSAAYDLKAQAAVGVSSGSFTAALAATTVTTFVGK